MFVQEASPIQCENILMTPYFKSADLIEFKNRFDFENIKTFLLDEKDNIYIGDTHTNIFSIKQKDKVIEVNSAWLQKYEKAPNFVNSYAVVFSKDRVFYRYTIFENSRNVQKLLVFSYTGDLIKEIDLSAYYPRFTVFSKSMLPDRDGGVFLLFDGLGMVHFNKDFLPFLVVRSPDEDLFDFLVGWDGQYYNVFAKNNSLLSFLKDDRFMFIEAKEVQSDIFSNIAGKSINNIIFIGVTRQNQAVFSLVDEKKQNWVLEYNTETKAKKYANISHYWDTPAWFTNFNIDQNGNIYFIRDIKDRVESIDEKFVKCWFSQ